MKTIFKYPFTVDEEINIMMPEGAEILKVDIQLKEYVRPSHLAPEDSIPVLWALVDINKPRVLHKFLLFGTGNRVSDKVSVNDYIGTFYQGIFVWHLFKV